MMIYKICGRRMMNLRWKFLTQCTNNIHEEKISKQGRIIHPQSGRSERAECEADTKAFLSDVYKISTLAKKRQLDATQYGRSMVEMLGALAIIGVLSVGGIAGYSKAMNKYKINKTTDQISTIIANTRTAFYSQESYAGLNNALAVKLGIMPNDMYDTNSCNATSCTLTNSYGGDVIISSSSAFKNGDEKAFVLEYRGFSRETCLAIATGDWGSDQGSGLIALAITYPSNGSIDSFLDSTISDMTLDQGRIAAPNSEYIKIPIEVRSATDFCYGPDGNNNSDITYIGWKYY